MSNIKTEGHRESEIDTGQTKGQRRDKERDSKKEKRWSNI
jgi:hypothetical protein